MKREASWLSKVTRAIFNQTGEVARLTTPEQIAAALDRRGMTHSGANVTPDSAMRVAAVYACVRVLADSIAQLPLRLYEESADGAESRVATDRGAAFYDRLTNRRPHPVLTPFDFKRMMVGHTLLRGNFYAEKSLIGTAGQILTPLNPERMRVEVDDNTNTLAYVYRSPNGLERVIPAARMLHVRGFSHDGLVGMSVVRAAAEAIGLALTTESHGARMFSAGAAPSGVLRHPAALSPEAATRLKASFDEKYAGSGNSGGTMLLEEGLTWERVGMTSDESQFIEARKLQRSEIAMFFGVPPHMIGDVERGTSWGSGIEQQGLGFVTYTLMPHLTNIAQAFERDLIPASMQDRYSYKFDTADLTRADFLTRQQGLEIQKRNGVISANEWRREERRNPRQDGSGDSFDAAADAPPPITAPIAFRMLTNG